MLPPKSFSPPTDADADVTMTIAVTVHAATTDVATDVDVTD